MRTRSFQLLADLVEKVLVTAAVDARQLMLLLKSFVSVFIHHVGVAFKEHLIRRNQFPQEYFHSDPNLFLGPISIHQRVHPGPLLFENKLAGSCPQPQVLMLAENVSGNIFHL
jgi:hypothetical protein